MLKFGYKSSYKIKPVMYIVSRTRYMIKIRSVCSAVKVTHCEL